MSGQNSSDFHKRITLAGSLIAIGIVFGDIGTSPLYTLNAVFHNKIITEAIALGSLSCIFWTLVFRPPSNMSLLHYRPTIKVKVEFFLFMP
nr:KUP/HAK/KT family potassium transporter [Chryseobacterium timonianum]